MNAQQTINRAVIVCTFIATCALSAALLTGCNQQEGPDAPAGQSAQDISTEAGTQESQDSEDSEPESITAHGSTYEKAETVSATSTLSGEITAIAVDEWLKNPEGLDVIEDVSTLQQIATTDDGITFTQDGENLSWQTNGEDVHYSGITNAELPFNISYSYKLGGAEIDPSELVNATGHLELCISYENKTQGTVDANGTSYSVQQPFAMASLISFDAEHAQNVKVDNGQVVDQDGSFIAVGLAMPGLTGSLDIEDMVSLPESVTIEADVTGFDMPNITTMASNQVLSMIDEESTNDLSSDIDDAFSQVDSIKKATNQLSKGTSAIGKALSTIAQGQSQLNEAFPNATSGLDQLSQGSQSVGALIDEASQTLADDGEALAQIDTQISSLKDELANLRALDTEGMNEEQAAALEEHESELEDIIAQLESAQAASKQASDTAVSKLSQASDANSTLTNGLQSASAGLTQIQSGYEQLTQALEKVSEAAGKLSKGTKKMSKGVAKAIEEARDTIEGKIDLVEALADYADAQGAFCGNASDMPASTTYVITAEA